MPSIIRPETLETLDITLKSAFLQAYESKKYTPRWERYATRQTSDSRSNYYSAIIDAAKPREWIGERVVNGVHVIGAEVVNKKWELTYGIPREAIDDDLKGITRQAVSQIRSGGAKFAKQPDKLCVAVLTGNTTCLDGLALFHASHKVNPADPASSTFSNTDSGALTPAEAAEVRAAMMSMVDPAGDPINEGEDQVLLVPPALETIARRTAQADIIIDSGTATDNVQANVFKGAFTVVVEPRLGAAAGGSDTAWYMVDASDPEDRAVIFQVREEVELVSLWNLTDPNVFNLDEYVWGLRARHVAAAGNPKKIFRRTG